MSVQVSVVVRTKDRPQFLARALQDVSHQTFGDWEVVVANDGGERADIDRVVSASGLGDRIRVSDVGRPGGRCAAANAGVRLARGEYVVLHDDDDLWDPDFLRQTSAWLDDRPQDVAVAVSTAIVYESLVEGEWRETSRAPFWAGMSRISLTEMLEMNRAVPISVLYRRAIHDEVGWYDESLDAVEDWELFLRILPKHGIGFIAGGPLAFWTQRPGTNGSVANSMFALQDQHVSDDALVRDRALGAWVEENGLGLPLYIAAVEKRIVAHMDASVKRLEASLRAEIDAHQPVASRLRRLRRRISRPR